MKKELLDKLMEELRKQSAGYGFVTDESIKMFEEQFVFPILTTAYDAGYEEGEKEFRENMWSEFDKIIDSYNKGEMHKLVVKCYGQGLLPPLKVN